MLYFVSITSQALNAIHPTKIISTELDRYLVKMFSMLFRFIFCFHVANQSHCRFILGCLPPEECLAKECLVINNASSLQTFSFSHLANIFSGNLIQSLIGNLDESDSEDNTARSNLHTSDLD